MLRALTPSSGFVRLDLSPKIEAMTALRFLNMISPKGTSKLQVLPAPQMVWGVPFQDARIRNRRLR